MNDDAIRAVKLIAGKMADAVLEGGHDVLYTSAAALAAQECAG